MVLPLKNLKFNIIQLTGWFEFGILLDLSQPVFLFYADSVIPINIFFNLFLKLIVGS
ncbi:hypothetical protein SAMN04488013_10988 [Marinilactibacillus psychrotolerans]|nr:hypothetical protein SAMN04488013_10988 [Marinilactibacillus psychrotolerans]